MKVLSAILLSAFLTSCAVYPSGYYTAEPDVYVGPHYVGYYQPGFGYWTGYGWDMDFYLYGHPGYGHSYRGRDRDDYGHYNRGESHDGYRGNQERIHIRERDHDHR